MQEKLVKQHFDILADSYDYFKKNNFLGYQELLKSGLKKYIPKGKRIFDFGCGTGEILNSLNPSFGMGYDLSPKMIEIAKRKYSKKKNLKFFSSLKQVSGQFDYIIMVDVIEHLSNPEDTFRSISKLMAKDTKFIMTFFGPFWEPFLWVLEKLGKATPEGPHKRLASKEIVRLATKSHLEVMKYSYLPLTSIFPFFPSQMIIFKRK